VQNSSNRTDDLKYEACQQVLGIIQIQPSAAKRIYRITFGLQGSIQKKICPKRPQMLKNIGNDVAIFTDDFYKYKNYDLHGI
jgi:hypothetical protein